MLTKNKSRNIKRLLYLATEVAKTKPDKKAGNRPPFYFGSYADVAKWDGKNQTLTCGTTACAIGLASILPVFRRLGLRLAKYDGNSYFSVQPFMKGGEHENEQFSCWLDVAKKLGLGSDEYYALFIPDSSPTFLPEEASPTDVANNIRSFCKAAKKNQENDWMNQ